MKPDNYNIKIDSPQPDSEQIRKHQDFDALLQAYENEPQKPERDIKRLVFYAGVAAAFLLAVGWGINNMDSNSERFADERPFINEPLMNVKPQFASYSFDAYSGGVYEHESGSRLIIPAQAFVNAEGLLVAGQIQMRYREMHDFVDFFLSGIPMQYDSSGTQYWLESSGMIEVYVEQNGEPLTLTAGKSLEIELVSTLRTSGGTDGFNIYKLDKKAKNWEYAGPDKLTVLASNTPDHTTTKSAEEMEWERQILQLQSQLKRWSNYEDQQIQAIRDQATWPETPAKPQKANPESFVFDLDVNEDRFPDLAEYQSVKWQVTDDPQNAEFSAEVYQIDWIDARLEPLNEKRYELTLVNENQEVKVLVKPVLSGNDLLKAEQKYQLALANYENQKEEIENQLAPNISEKKRNLENERSDIEAQITSLYEKLNDQEGHRQAAAGTLVSTHRVLNEFTVNSLGIWNCDRPVAPTGNQAQATFVNAEGQEYLDSPVYLANPARNTVNRFYTSENEKIQTDQSQEQLVWLVTPEGRIAITRASQSTRNTQGELEFVMEEIDQKVQNETDLRSILRFN